jgi:branched-chain amino acid aminotransferase
MTQLTLATSTAYFRGKFVPFADANVSIASSPFLYGLAIYTVFSATYNPEHKQLYLFRLRDHYDRLVNSARIMDFEDFAARYSFETFQDTMQKLIEKNNVHEDALIRAMVFIDELAAGTRIRGLKNEMAVFVYPMGEVMPAAGAHVCVSSWQRTGDNMMPSRAKVNGSYINASLMKNEAIVNGFDEAISLDTLGHVAEGTVANVFIVRGGTLLTPDTSTDILEGITRDSVLHMAAELDIPVIERAIDRSELYAADEAMFVGSSARITPILSIDRRPVGSGQPGPITKRLSEHYSKLQHGLLAHNWLTGAYELAGVHE